jgi:ComF family protein
VDLVTAAADLLLGAECPGCGRPARSLCAGCAVAITPRPAVVRTRPVDVAASGDYAGELRLVIVAWKEEGRSGLLGALAHLLAASVVEVTGLRPITLVPVPTRSHSRRARGADLVDQLARCAAGVLHGLGADVTVRQALRVARRTADQSRLGARERVRNLDGAFTLRSSAGLAGRQIVVVDDIVTTGATLREAVRALREAGHRPSSAAVVAHRARRRGRSAGRPPAPLVREPLPV